MITVVGCCSSLVSCCNMRNERNEKGEIGRKYDDDEFEMRFEIVVQFFILLYEVIRSNILFHYFFFFSFTTTLGRINM
jgi:hypothetical protein